MNTTPGHDTSISGLQVAVATPITADLQIDRQRLLSHCNWLLEQNCDGLSLFGTTGEGPSLSITQRIGTLAYLLDKGLPAATIIVGCGVAAMDDAVVLLRQALELDCTKTLALPPFFFKTPRDDGVLRFYSELIERTGDNRLQLLLYNIPALSGVQLTYPVIEQLAQRFPQTVIGVKDSSGDWEYTQGLLARFPQLTILIGAENHLPQGIAAGAAGTISGLSNVSPLLVERLLGRHGISAQQASVSAIEALLKLLLNYPLIPAIKGLIAYNHGDEAWRRMLPPLAALADAEQAALLQAARPLLR